MPYQFDFDPTNRILRGRLDGCVTDEVIKDYYRAAAAYAARLDPCLGITDLSAVTSFEVSPETLRVLAHSTPVMPDPSRVRVILAPDDHAFGMARLFQLEGGEFAPAKPRGSHAEAGVGGLGRSGPSIRGPASPVLRIYTEHGETEFR
jgi:hypothetical protein